jgi:hypothetical protein
MFENRLSILNYDDDDTMKEDDPSHIIDDMFENELYEKFQNISLNEDEERMSRINNDINELKKFNLEDKIDEENMDETQYSSENEEMYDEDNMI